MLDLLYNFKIRGEDKVVDLAYLFTFFINIAYFRSEYKPHGAEFPKSRAGGGASVFLFQPVKALLGRLQLFFQLLEPAGMGKIAGPDYFDSLDPCPEIDVFGSELFTCRDRIVGMDMKITGNFHGSFFEKMIRKKMFLIELIS